MDKIYLHNSYQIGTSKEDGENQPPKRKREESNVCLHSKKKNYKNLFIFTQISSSIS